VKVAKLAHQAKIATKAAKKAAKAA